MKANLELYSRYEVLERLGDSGTYTEVYKGIQRKLDGLVVVLKETCDAKCDSGGEGAVGIEPL